MPRAEARSRRVAISAIVVALAACVHVGPAPDEALRAGNADHASDSELGLAALVELDRGSGDSAAALLRRTPRADEPLALLARLLACKRDLDAPCEVRTAARLLERFPHAPMALIAAATLQRLGGLSLTLDKELIDDLAQILAAPPESRPDLECQQRLRDTLATLLVSRLDYARAQALREQSGLLQDWEILGPLSPYHYLEFDTPLGPEREPDAASFAAPWSLGGGRERWRPLRMNNGQLPLGHALELNDGAEEGRARPPQGDLVYVRTTVQARGGGVWLRVESTASLLLFLDGKRVLERDLFRRVLPRVQWLEVPASEGPHRLLVKAAVGDSGRSLRIEVLPRSSGRPPPPAAKVSSALQALAGDALGHELAALAIAEIDPHAALAELTAAARTDGEAGGTPGALGLAVRAELWGALDTLTDDDARGRSQRDVDAWIARDSKSSEARLRRAQVFAELNRLPLAQQDLDSVARPASAVLVAKARIQMQRDAAPLAVPLLRRVLANDPGDCPALELLLTADDTANAFLQTEALSKRQADCPGGSQARAQFLARTQGPSILTDYWRGRLERSPGDPEAALQLSEALEGTGDIAGARAALDTRLKSWPDDGAALRREATLEDLSGNGRTPSRLWPQLLGLEPSDLQLRRALALLSDKPAPLEALLPGVAESLAAKRWASPERAPSATVLDSGAAWLHLDGTITERVRSLEMPLDENALGPLGELELPPGAALLALRTHKPDGRVLDADAQVSGEKHTVSASSLQVGDLLEIDYLMTTPPARRGRGAAAEAFYFTAGDSSLQRSIYRIGADDLARQPRPLEIDRHRVDAPPSLSNASGGIVTVERTHVSALPDEPSQPPQSEFFPWVQVGSGATAKDLARSIADQVLDKTTLDEGLRAIVDAVAVLPARDEADRAAQLWSKLLARVRVEGGTLAEAASEVIGRGSGDLVLPMRAALRGLGIASHLVLVSGPAQPREPHRFARLADYGDVLLRIEPRSGAPVYLAAAVRDAPFGRIPPNLCGAPALVLPNDDAGGPSDSAEIHLPACPDPGGQSPGEPAGPDDHLLELQLTVAPNGSADGVAREVLYGFEATAVRGSIEQLDDDQRRQGVESALAGVFTGVALSDLSFQIGEGPGTPLAVSYRFHVPDLADHESDGTWSLPLKGFPAQLQERFTQLASRRVPLMVAAGERPRLELTLRLPAGATFESSAPADVWLQVPFGAYLRRERREGSGGVTLTEKLVLPAQRVSVDQYPAFAGFAQQVDGAQGERVRYRLPQAGASAKAAAGSGSPAL